MALQVKVSATNPHDICSKVKTQHNGREKRNDSQKLISDLYTHTIARRYITHTSNKCTSQFKGLFPEEGASLGAIYSCNFAL